MLWEVFVSRFEEALEQYERHRLTAEEAGELLGMSGAISGGCAFAMRRMGSKACVIAGSAKYRHAGRRRVNSSGCTIFIVSAIATSQ
jgi:hypothetical protein